MEVRTIKRTKKNGEFLMEISDISTPNTKTVFSVYGYKKPDCSLYVNGIWISRAHMIALIHAMTDCLEFSK